MTHQQQHVTSLRWILPGGKSEKVYELEVFCEVVGFPRVERDFLFRGCEVIFGNKYFLRWFPKFF